VVVHHPEGFGPHGRLATIGGLAWPSGQERTAVTGDGRIYVAATPGPSVAPEAVRVRRYLPDGKPDASFGLAGDLILDELGGGFHLDELLVDTNGLPYLVGTTGDGELVVARLDQAGEPDPTYGDDGLARLGPRPSDATPPRATIDQTNRIIVAAGAAVDRLTSTGTLDPTFGTDGAVPLPSSDVEGLGVDEKGRVQVALPDRGDDGKGFRLMRLDEDGRPSTRTFRSIGEVRAMAVRYDGSTLIVGTASRHRGDDTTVPLLSIGSRSVDGRVHRSSAHLRGRGFVTDILSDPNGDDYLVGGREIVDLDIRYTIPQGPRGEHMGGTVDSFGRAGRVVIGSPGGLIAMGASIPGGGTILVDGISRPRTGGPAHGFLAKVPAAEQVIYYMPESIG
jgi:hypothetical protein